MTNPYDGPSILDMLGGDADLPAIVEPEPMIFAPDVSDEDQRQQRWARFHERNPHVYDLLVRMARGLVAKGREHFGIRMLWETLRWRYTLQTDTDDFKLNDHYTSFYARLIMAEHQELDRVFAIRKRKKE